MAKIISGKVARKYADALLRSFELTELAAVEKSLSATAKLWKENSDFRTRLMSPTVLASEKEAALMEIGQLVAAKSDLGTGSDKGDYFARFLVLLGENGRLDGISEVSTAFTELLAQLRSELSVEVVTANEVSEVEKKEVLDKLGSFSGSSVAGQGESLSTITWRVDPSLIGGAILRCGDKEIDGSILGALNTAKNELLAR